MTTKERFVDELLAIARSMWLKDNKPMVAREGIVVGGSHDPKDGTVSVQFGDTASLLTGALSDGDTPNVPTRMPFGTTQLGDQYGPVGGERVMCIPTQSGFIAIPHHDDDDSPGAPAGERWICHRNASGAIDAYIKLTNDGDTSDALGGISLLAGSRFFLQTAMGFAAEMDDSLKAIAFATPGGLKLILDDKIGKILIGKGGLTPDDAVMTQIDAQTLANAIIASVQTAFNTFAATVQSGSGTPPPTVGPVTATGSSITESEE